MELNMLKVKLRIASKFKYGGTPGKKITNESKDEILKFLDYKKNVYKISNIEIVEKV